MRHAVVVAALVALLVVPATAGGAFDPLYEQQNYSKIDERAKFEFSDPAFQAELREKGAQAQAEKERIRLSDPERDFTANLCGNHQDGCAGDFRLYDWAANGFGLRQDRKSV